MGIGGAAIMPVTLSIISNVFDPRERGKAIGVWSGAVGLAIAVGPILGGAMLEHFWWGSVFLINVPVVVVGLIAVSILVPESRDPRPGRIDFAGVVMSVVGLVGLTYGIIKGGEDGFGSPTVLVTGIGGLLVLAAFVWFESRTAFPSLDVRLFKIPRFSAPIAAIGLTFFASMGVFFFSSFYLQLVRGYSPLETGLLFLPFAGAQLLFAPRSHAAVKRFGAKAVTATGLSLVTLSLVGFIWVGEATAIWYLCLVFFIQGVGMANIMAPSTESIMSALPREKAGVGSAVSNTIRQVASALGIAILGSILAAVYRGQIEDTTAALPGPAQSVANESISGAYGVAAQSGPAGGGLISAANDAFITAMHWAAGAGAIVLAFGIIAALIWMPGRQAGAEHVQPVEADARELATAG
jgi:EmrB/QacA subfamily drug resistance transporter